MTRKRKRVAIYLRVSKGEQTTANQAQRLKALAKSHDWQVVEIFRDDGISGAKGRDKRPGFDALCKGVARREFDMVAAWSLDRLGRSLRHLILFLDDLNAKKIGLYLHEESWDTTTATGELMFTVVAAFAQFERRMAAERIRAGLARTTKRLGRPPTVTDEQREAVLKASAAGSSIREIAKDMGLSRSTVQRIIAPSE